MLHKIAKCPQNKDGVSGCYPACSITNGFGGAGAYSDGKFNITSEFGGWMTDYLSASLVEELICYVDSINLKYGATHVITDPTTEAVKEIEHKAIGAGLKLLRSRVRHLGTENNLQILQRMFDDLAKVIDMRFECEASDVIVRDGKVCGVMLGDEFIETDKVLLSVGRDGSIWLEEICRKHHIDMTHNQVDIGVRVETSDIVMQEINKHLYEGKFLYRTSVGTTVRTFCSNPSGHVVVETIVVQCLLMDMLLLILSLVQEILILHYLYLISLKNHLMSLMNMLMRYHVLPINYHVDQLLSNAMVIL